MLTERRTSTITSLKSISGILLKLLVQIFTILYLQVNNWVYAGATSHYCDSHFPSFLSSIFSVSSFLLSFLVRSLYRAVSYPFPMVQTSAAPE